MTVKIKYADFQQITRSRSRPGLVATHDDLLATSLELVRGTLPTPKGVRLVGVTVSNFGEGEVECLAVAVNLAAYKIGSILIRKPT